MIAPGDLVILGFSGGPDSLCLFHALLELKGSMGFELAAAHINHGIRGEAADEDMRWAMEYSASCGVPCMASAADVPNYAKRRHLTEEEAGRMVRRDVFAYLAYGLATGKEMGKHPAGELLAKAPLPRFDAGRGSVRVALAHNLDDQAETVLMRIIRGTGTRGLSGIKYKSPMVDALMRVAAGLDDDELRKNAKSLDISIIRPLLDVPRTEIEAYCNENGLDPVTDHTNNEPIYTRNKIRLELLPVLEHYNENIVGTLTRLGRIAAADKEYLWKETEQAFEQLQLTTEDAKAKREDQSQEREAQNRECVISGQERETQTQECVTLDRVGLADLPDAIRHRVIAKAFSEIGLTSDISEERLRAADEINKKKQAPKKVQFPRGYSLIVKQGRVSFCPPGRGALSGRGEK